MPSTPAKTIPRHTHTTIGRGLAACCCLICLTGWAQGAETNQLSSEFVIPKSVFVAEGATGRDPFFPNSIRLRAKVPDTTKAPQITEDFSRLLKLTGVTGGVKPIATINNLTFAVGEEQEVKVDGRKVRIRNLEIGEKSVRLSVENQPGAVELKLRDNELPITKP